MIFQNFQSGSDGNCSLIQSNRTAILVDVGISRKKVLQYLCDRCLDASRIQGILITHEHTDHTNGLFTLFKHNPIPVYGSAGTIEMLQIEDKQGVLLPEYLHPIGEETFSIGDLTITPFPTYHDAQMGTGYLVSDGFSSFGFLTDTGKTDERMVGLLKEANGLLLEFNHDIRMLETGPYPFNLKRRILSDYGHLSNESAAAFIKACAPFPCKHLFVGHISKENNLPDIAYMTAENAIRECGLGETVTVHLTSHTAPSDAVEL